MKAKALRLLKETLILGISTGLGVKIGDTIQEIKNNSANYSI